MSKLVTFRQTQLLESHVSGHMVKREVTAEGEVQHHQHHQQHQHHHIVITSKKSSWTLSGSTNYLTSPKQEIPYHLQRMEFGAEIDGTEDFFQVKSCKFLGLQAQ